MLHIKRWEREGGRERKGEEGREGGGERESLFQTYLAGRGCIV